MEIRVASHRTEHVFSFFLDTNVVVNLGKAL